MPRQIDAIRKMSCHDLAVLIEEAVNYDLASDCPLCIGCKKAKKNGWDCVKAREEYLKGKLPDERL